MFHYFILLWLSCLSTVEVALQGMMTYHVEMWRVCDPIQDTMVEDCLEAGRCVNKLWSHHPQVIWEAFEQYITCKVPPNSPVKLPWLTAVKAMIDDEHGRGIFYGSMILKCLGDPPSHARIVEALPGQQHGTPCLRKSRFFCGLSLSRNEGCWEWNRDLEWILNLQKHTKATQSPHNTITLVRLKLRGCHDCCWSGTRADWGGFSFWFVASKTPKEAAIEQLGELEKLDRCTED